MCLAFSRRRLPRTRSWVERARPLLFADQAANREIGALTRTQLISATRSFHRDRMTGREIDSPRSSRRPRNLIFFQSNARSWRRQFCPDFTVRRAPAHPCLYKRRVWLAYFYLRDIGTFTAYPADPFYDRR